MRHHCATLVATTALFLTACAPATSAPSLPTLGSWGLTPVTHTPTLDYGDGLPQTMYHLCHPCPVASALSPAPPQAHPTRATQTVPPLVRPQRDPIPQPWPTSAYPVLSFPKHNTVLQPEHLQRLDAQMDACVVPALPNSYWTLWSCADPDEAKEAAHARGYAVLTQLTRRGVDPRSIELHIQGSHCAAPTPRVEILGCLSTNPSPSPELELRP